MKSLSRRRGTSGRMHACARDLEQERKRWVKQQEIRHDYGEEDGKDDPEVDHSTGVRELLSSSSVSGPDRAVIIASKKKCRCGSTTHLRTSHREWRAYE